MLIFEQKKSITQSDYKELLQHIQHNKEKLIGEFEQVKNDLQRNPTIIYDINSANYNFAQQIVNFKNYNDSWVPFNFNEQNYIFNNKKPKDIKILIPFSNVHSTGLKSCNVEQMIFNKGLSIPFDYQYFLNDLITKIKDAGVKHIVFVNFLSMYPRTSRENIRVNFLKQYLISLFPGQFDIDKSFYKHMIHKEREIYHMLQTDFEIIKNNVILEAAFRQALFDIIGHEDASCNLKLLNSTDLFTTLKNQTESILRNNGLKISDVVNNKLSYELQQKHDLYHLDRTYINIIDINLADLQKLSLKIQKIFTDIVDNNYLNKLWHGLDGQLPKSGADNLKTGSKIKLDTGIEMVIVDTINIECKDKEKLDNFCKRVRAQWYATLSQLLDSKVNENNQLIIDKIFLGVAPLIIRISDNGTVYALQSQMKSVGLKNKEAALKHLIKFHVIESDQEKKWGIFDNVIHCLDWDNPGTFFGLYGYSYILPIISNRGIISTIFDDYFKECINQSKMDFGMPTSFLLKKIEQQELWSKIEQEINSGSKDKIETILQNDPRVPGIKLFILSIATLENILKDVKSLIFSRRANKDDFAASVKLLESLTLPLYFDKKLAEPLFANYYDALPII